MNTDHLPAAFFCLASAGEKELSKPAAL